MIDWYRNHNVLYMHETLFIDSANYLKCIQWTASYEMASIIYKDQCKSKRKVQEQMLCLIDYKFGISLAKVIKLGEEQQGIHLNTLDVARLV